MLLELFYHHPNLLGKKFDRSPFREGSEEELVQGESATIMRYSFLWGFGWKNKLNAPQVNISSREALQSPSGSASLLDLTSHDVIVDIEPLGCHTMWRWLHHCYGIFWIVVLLPVPMSRVILHDHSLLQIFVGSILGIILGMIWFFCIIRGHLVCFHAAAGNCKDFMDCVVASRVGK